MARLFYLLWLIPVAVILGGIWLILLLPTFVAAFIGYAVLILALIGGVGFALLALFASGMKS